jgi:hypothetical protein
VPRFLATSPDPALIGLPWGVPLADWPTQHLVALPRGLSRHVVRFIRVGSQVLAAKEIPQELAEREYSLLTALSRLNVPAVEVVGVVSDRLDAAAKPLDPVLLTRHLQFSLPYRSLFTPGVRRDTVARLLDAMVVLIVRLHLSGFMWGDASLSNILYRRDAGTYAAYLVDTETGELHDQISDGQRENDLAILRTNMYGDFLDLASGGLLDKSLEPAHMVDTIESRYRELWAELTQVEEFSGNELYRIEDRVRRLNALGFDVAELSITTSPDGAKVRVHPRVVDAGHHQRRLMQLTGLDTEEHQARRLLNDMDVYRAATHQEDVDDAQVAHEWLTQCFSPVIDAIPPELSGKRDPAQLYHEVLDYRWYQSQREHRSVPMLEAVRGYIHDVLSALPDEKLATDWMLRAEDSRRLARPYDPAMGFAGPEPDDDTPIVDPWEAGLDDVDVNAAGVLDRTMLAARASGS